MDDAKLLYETLESFKQPDPSGATSEQRLLEYCEQVLGSIERVHFDFKGKSDRRDARLGEADKKNLAKAISGFANSAGGVLIWGIADQTIQPKPITHITQFVTNLLQLAPGVTDPTVPGVDGFALPSACESGAGYGVIYVPESTLPPHRVVLQSSDVRNHYYIRSASSFVVASHTQLEDMFGRRPKPQLMLTTRFVRRPQSTAKPNTVRLWVILGIHNEGRGAARAPFLSVRVHAPYHLSKYGIDGNYGFGLAELTVADDSAWRSFGARMEPILHAGMTHEVVAIEAPIPLDQQQSAISDLLVDYQLAAEGIPLRQDRLMILGRQLLAEAEKPIAHDET